MEFVDTNKIKTWFKKFDKKTQEQLSFAYLKHTDIDLLTDADMVVIYARHKIN